MKTHSHYSDPEGPDEFSPDAIFDLIPKHIISMKKKLTFLKNKLRLAWQWLAGQTLMIWHWFKNLCFIFLTSKSEPRIFQGYGHWWFAKKYADKRAKMSRVNKICGGKRHFVLPWNEYSLIVINKTEINSLKARRIVNKNLNVNEIFKTAYYLTK